MATPRKRPPFKRPPFERSAWREWLVVIVPTVLIIAALTYVASRFIQPAPPNSIIITTGGEGGAYYQFAKRYQAALRGNGIELVIKTSAGSMQNLARLRGTTPEASVAFVQGGTTNPEDSNSMLSLGRMFYEPLWVFHRLPQDIDRLAQLQGKKIAVGPAGSGTRALATQLLGAAGITAANATLLESPGADAAAALLAGDVDAAFFVAAPDAELVQKLLRSRGIILMNLTHAQAYARRFPWLDQIVLHKGVIDFSQNIPSGNIELVAAVALIAVRDDVHPALQFALAQAAAEVHRAPGIFNGEGHFPQSQSTELPMSPVAERFHKVGPPFFQRYLPFWLAVWMDRLVVLLVPLVAILIPVMKLLPSVYDWRVRRPLWKWYDALRKLETAMADQPEDTAKHQQELQRIDDGIATLPLPVKYSEAHHNLRSYAEYVRRHLDASTPAVSSEGSGSPG
jgi:TRAP-type uncharacterized transport system substrate-binding protein